MCECARMCNVHCAHTHMLINNKYIVSIPYTMTPFN